MKKALQPNLTMVMYHGIWGSDGQDSDLQVQGDMPVAVTAGEADGKADLGDPTWRAYSPDPPTAAPGAARLMVGLHAGNGANRRGYPWASSA